MKAQVALEYLMVTSIIIAMVVTVFVFVNFYSTDSVASARAQDAVNAIAKLSDSSYSLGKGSFLTTTVTIPDGVINSSVNGRLVTLTIRTSSGVTTVIGSTIATVNGSIPKTRGVFKISANMTAPNVTLGNVTS